jgi:hypothetical protein
VVLVVKVSWLYERVVFDKESVFVDTLVTEILTVEVLLKISSLVLVEVS